MTSKPALLPVIPEKVRIHPLTAALLTTAAFLDLCEDDQVKPEAAQLVLERVGLYVQRLSDEAADRLAADLERLSKYAQQAGWPEDAREFVDQFMSYCGFAVEGDDETDGEEGEDGDEEGEEGEDGDEEGEEAEEGEDAEEEAPQPSPPRNGPKR